MMACKVYDGFLLVCTSPVPAVVDTITFDQRGFERCSCALPVCQLALEIVS